MDSYEYDYDGEVPRFWFSSRFAMAVLGFIGFLSMSSQRMCISVALACMLNQTAVQEAQIGQTSSSGLHDVIVRSVDGHNETTFNGSTVKQPTVVEKACGGIPEIFVLNTSEFHHLHNGEFVWPSTTQAAIIDAFHWGYVLTQVPSGWLAQRYGGKRVFGFLLLASSLSTSLIPIAARTHLFLLLTLRFIGGLGAGATFPAMHTLWGKWAPPQERSLLASITYAGSLTGSVGIFPLAGLLCEYGIDGKGFDGGWPAIFYIFGALGVVWFILWMIFASESPAEHGRISVVERQYIVDTLMTEAVTSRDGVTQVPWYSVLTSFPFIAIVLCNFTYEWGVFTFEKLFPVFQKEVLQLDIKLNSMFALLPYLGLWVMVIASGGGADRLQSHGVLATTATRKVMQTIGAIVPACMVAANGFIDCTQWRGAISFMTIGFAFSGFQYNGFLVNHLDIAPRFAGILMGIANAIGSTARFWLPYFVSVVMSTSEDIYEQWQTVFLITSSFYVFSTAFYLLCGSGRIQSWALDKPAGRSQPNSIVNPLTGTRPNSLCVRELSSPGNPPPAIYSIKPSIDSYAATDTLRRAAEQPTEARIAQNHLSGGATDDADALNRKSSNKSTTSSKTREDVKAQARRTDHDREEQQQPQQQHRTRSAGSAKRQSKPSKSRPESGLEIYDSLSESPV